MKKLFLLWFYSSFCFQRCAQSLPDKMLHRAEVKKPRGVTDPCHALGKNQGQKWGINCHYREKPQKKRKCKTSHFPLIKPFLKMFEWQRGSLRIFASYIKLRTQRSHAQRTRFVSLRCINQELLWDKIKVLSRMGKQEFIEQRIYLGLITLLMGFPLLETYGYNPCKPWKGSKY